MDVDGQHSLCLLWPSSLQKVECLIDANLLLVGSLPGSGTCPLCLRDSLQRGHDLCFDKERERTRIVEGK